ncbi:nitrogen permease regulator of amino acid transport activity 3-domain-containing protein [Dichomitus squalens]|uniref:Nitrogen permease regulator 3 n=1 Tax=Dichomitus squalens TaxID=114155 RepID=A0A4Q9Q6E9_9APHY|nr:nitrogen permease regulator of amino acid transport activity 3-domain-containing protein [Dichomitus squalens]TBU62919.1 nitrogen permease regulator of amino acid transport activity 3-domain-containing protein [Dichomitus squalens]
MSETLLCILLVSSSAKGSNLVYHWPPSCKPIPRLARPLPTNDFPGAFADNPWRAANSPDNPTEDPSWLDTALAPEDLTEYYWERPSARRDRTASFTHPTASHPTSRRASPSKDDKANHDGAHLGQGLGSPCDEYDNLLGFSAEFLAQVLCPQRSMCHQKFELIVDDLAFIGHPVCADSDGGWRFKQEKAKAAARGRGSKKGQSPANEEKTLTPERMERGELNDGSLGRNGRLLPPDSGGMQTFHFVIVLDLPDPSSSASGNIAKYFDTIYEQIAFKVTAVLYQEQVISRYVETECDLLSSLRDDFANRGESYADFVYEALKISTIAPAMKTLYESIKDNTIASVTLNDLPLELQLPPYLDSLLHAIEDVDCEGDIADEYSEPNAWGPEMSFAWRLPALTPWKALLRIDDEDDEQGYQLYMQLRAAQLHPEERELAEQLIRFIDLASVMLSLAEMASLLDWHLESQVYPAVRWLVLHRRAKIVDVVHPSLKTVFSVPQRFPSPLATLSEEFSKRFAQADVPLLPKLLAMISTATHKQTTNHFYATVVKSKEYIPLYVDVVLWMLKRDLLIRLHLRIRIIATEELKKRVRQSWEEHVARKRSRSRPHSISRTRASRRRGSESNSRDLGREDDTGEKAGLNLETVSESSPVEYWVSLSPKTMRKQTRRGADEHGKPADGAREEGDGEEEDTERHEREKHDDLDEEFLSSSADETKWEEYYQNGGNDNIPSMISDPARATPLERRWLAGMSEGKEPHIVRRFERIHQYFDGKCSDDEILYSAEISRKQLREVLHHYEEYLQTFLHPS